MWQGATVPVSLLSSSCQTKLESPETYPIEASVWESVTLLELQVFRRILRGRSLRNVDQGILRRWKGSIEIENKKVEGVHLETQVGFKNGVWSVIVNNTVCWVQCVLEC